MSSLNYRSRSRGDSIARRVIEVIPDTVCRLPIQSVDPAIIASLQISRLNSIIQSIKIAWSIARECGVANISWGTDKKIHVKVGQKRSGFNLYGICHDRRYRTLDNTVLNSYVIDAICSYRHVRENLEQRVAHSYSEIMSIAGGLSIKADDDVIKKVSQEYQKNGRSLIAPVGSELSIDATSLVDLERVIDIYYKVIAQEANIPLWLWMDIPPATVHDSSHRAIYLQAQYDQFVRPALTYLLNFDETISVRDLQTPSYRDTLYDLELEQIAATIEQGRAMIKTQNNTRTPVNDNQKQN